MRRRKYNLFPGILTVLESLGVRAWVTPDRLIAHDGDEELREEIRQNIERVRPIGLRKTALFFGAVLMVAMDRGTFTPADIATLDHMGQGNALYLLEKLEGNENA
ncbi:hypothetical protein ABZX85_11565 [Streptomyces sp. NPDC004539]|uniref:hypothetical protein n=1 Tax=Streptomyces sp. NPDC004539 TaxID=3154280 RepID=UPI0033AD3286